MGDRFDTSKLASKCAGECVVQRSSKQRRDRRGAGVWMANAAPAVDENGDIYVVTGNGPYNPEFAHDQLGESVVKLTWTPGDPGSLSVSDWFTPFADADRDAVTRIRTSRPAA